MFKSLYREFLHEWKHSSTMSVVFQFLGIVAFFLVYTSDLQLETNAKTFLAIFSYVVIQWLLSSTPLFISGMMGVALTVLFGVVSFEEAFSSFSSQIIFLFMGGFLLARAMEKLGLDRKLSVTILNTRFIDGDFNRTLAVVIGVTCLFSMWVSNSATTAMMLPIGFGLLKSFKVKEEKTKQYFLLIVAYAASVGGMATPIGSPPNLITMGLLEQHTNLVLTFWDWCKFGFPLTIFFSIILFFYAKRKITEDIKKVDKNDLMMSLGKNNKITNNEIRLMLIFTITIFLWFAPSLCSLILGKGHIVSIYVQKYLTAGMVAIIAACTLFMTPIYSRTKLLDQDDIKTIDWGTLLLFGSGLSLGSTLFKTGIADFVANNLISIFSNWSFAALLVLVVGISILLTELVSNTAAANVLVPILIAAATQANYSSITAAFVVAFSCNMAFMLPVATPPNAIVYGTGLVPMNRMISFGVILNIVAFISLSLIVIMS
ncbi:SLC13 family permease [Halobacteriovorax sp. RT-2-4]|uniref:SLC13 family permease n=1 Tax=unclassified Halobacteriovorax TaxID=2639665 RepID=UPI00399B7BB8